MKYYSKVCVFLFVNVVVEICSLTFSVAAETLRGIK